MELSTYSSTKTINEFENAIEIFNNTIADFFNETTSYIIDDFVIYEGNLYQCINDCIGTWNSSNWQIQKIFDNDWDDIIKGGDSGITLIKFNASSLISKTITDLIINYID